MTGWAVRHCPDGPRSRVDHGWVDNATALALLARADAALDLPRLGGMARPTGVAIVSEERWAFAEVGGGEHVLAVPAAPSLVGRIPFLRGLVRLALALRPLFARGGSASPKERLVLLAAVVAPVPAAFLPQALSLAVMLVATLGLTAWILRGRTLFLHGAEHRAIAAAEARSLVATWRGETRPSRFSFRCGTNFAALVVPVTVLLDPGDRAACRRRRRRRAGAGADALDGALAAAAGSWRPPAQGRARARPRAPARDDARAHARRDARRAARGRGRARADALKSG